MGQLESRIMWSPTSIYCSTEGSYSMHIHIPPRVRIVLLIGREDHSNVLWQRLQEPVQTLLTLLQGVGEIVTNVFISNTMEQKVIEFKPYAHSVCVCVCTHNKG